MPKTKTRKNRDKQAAKQQQAQLTNSTKSNKKKPSKKSKNNKTRPITQPKDCYSGSTLSDWYTRRLALYKKGKCFA